MSATDAMNPMLSSLEAAGFIENGEVDIATMREILAALGMVLTDAEAESLFGTVPSSNHFNMARWLELSPRNDEHDFKQAAHPESRKEKKIERQDPTQSPTFLSAEQQYNAIVDAEGGEHSLKKGHAITKSVSGKLQCMRDSLEQEQSEIWDSLHEAKAKRLAAIAEELKVTTLRQDAIYACMPYDQMQRAALPVKEEFDRLLEHIRTKLEGSGAQAVHFSALKGKERGEKKVRVHYAGDRSQLTDMVRGTIEVEGSISDLYHVLEEIMKLEELSSSTVNVEVLKDRYQQPLKGGYRDISLMLRIRGMLCELQLNLKEVLKIKESTAGQAGYAQARLVDDDLLHSAMVGDFDALASAIAAGGDVNARTGRYGITALNFAACMGDEEAVKLLLASGADPCMVDRTGMLAVHRSAQGGFITITQRLLQAMKGKTAMDDNKSSVASKKFGELLGLAVDQGWEQVACDLYSWWRTGKSSVQKSFLRQWVELGWSTTITRAAQIFSDEFWDKEEETFFLAVAKLPQAVRTFLHKGFKATAQHPFLEANGFYVDLKTSNGCEQKFGAIDLASACGHKDVVELLRQHGAVPSTMQVASRVEDIAVFDDHDKRLDWLVIRDLCIAKQYLQRVPRQFFNRSQMQALRSLAIEECECFESLPGEWSEMQALQNITLDKCWSLKSLPGEWGKMQALQSITIKHCMPLSSLPSEWSQMQSLQSITIEACCSLKSLPGEWSQMQALQSVTIKNCEALESLPGDWSQMQALQSITVEGCESLASLPCEWSQMKALKSITINYCASFETLPCEWGKMRSVQRVAIEGCWSLASLPGEWSQMQALQSISIKKCRSLRSLPETWGHMHSNGIVIEECEFLGALPGEWV